MEPARGQLSVSNLNLHNVWKFAQPWLQLELKDGRLDVFGQYALDWSDALSYQVSNGRLKLYGLDIVPQVADQIPDTALGLQSLEIDDIALDSSTQQLTINSVQVTELAVATWQEDARVSLQETYGGSPAPVPLGRIPVALPEWGCVPVPASSQNGVY